jgi:hypothetical protein
VVDKEDGATELSVQGEGSSKTLRAHLSDLDTATNGISQRTIDFYSDTQLIGSAETDPDGVATLAVPAGHRGSNRTYEAVFEGDDFYLGSSDIKLGQGDHQCNANKSIVGQTVDNVIVPRGESCTLTDSTVNGSVKSSEDSTLDATGNTIGGSVEGDKAEKVKLSDNEISGSVTIKEGDTADGNDVVIDSNSLTNGSLKIEKMSGDILITDNTVTKGDISLIENRIGDAYVLLVDSNTVAKNSLKVEKNSGTGAKTVTNNEGGQDLSCKDNSLPFIGTPNGTWNKKEGQCAA